MFSRPFEVWVIYRIKKVPRLRHSDGRPGQADHLRIDSQPCRVCVGTNKTQTFVREPGRTAGPSATSGFPVRLGGFGEPHAAFLKESRIRGR
jgi:hypothetical protein